MERKAEAGDLTEINGRAPIKRGIIKHGRDGVRGWRSKAPSRERCSASLWRRKRGSEAAAVTMTMVTAAAARGAHAHTHTHTDSRAQCSAALEAFHSTRRRFALVLINAVMVTQNPPLDNSFCNYVDDTPGGHFGMSADVQIAE